MCAGAGCQFAPKDKAFQWPWKKKEAKPVPERILPVWTDSVLHQPNQPGVRGFGGRIYFYAKDDTDPIEVDGSLAVYVFDADETNAESQKPLRKFVFTKEQFQEHMSKTSIGPSYSIWLPWGEIGGPPRRLSLIARFEGPESGTTLSDPTIKLLPGVQTKEYRENESAESVAQSPSASRSPFRLSGHQKKSDPQTERHDRDETIEDPRSDIKTIDLPPSFQRHLRSNSSNATQNENTKANASSQQLQPNTLNQLSQLSQLGLTSQQSHPSDDEPAELPVTTQVHDYRTRKRSGAASFGVPKVDIRQGRWIESKKD